MYKDDARLTPGQNELARKLSEAGNESGEYTQEEKLALVAANMMAPEEVGLASAEDAQKQLTGEEPNKLKLGQGLRMEAWTVPLEIRAEWAYQDTKIILAPSDKAAWIEDWQQDNKETFFIQSRLHCGNGHMQSEQLFNDEVLGLAAMLKNAGQALEQLYQKSIDEAAKEPNEPTENKPTE